MVALSVIYDIYIQLLFAVISEKRVEFDASVIFLYKMLLKVASVAISFKLP